MYEFEYRKPASIPEAVQTMLDSLANLRAEGRDHIED